MNLTHSADPIILGELVNVRATLVHGYVAQRTNYDEVVVLVLTRVTDVTDNILLFCWKTTFRTHSLFFFRSRFFTELLNFVIAFEPIEPLVISFMMRTYIICNILALAIQLFFVQIFRRSFTRTFDHIFEDGFHDIEREGKSDASQNYICC